MQPYPLSFTSNDHVYIFHETCNRIMPWVDVERSKPAGTKEKNLINVKSLLDLGRRARFSPDMIVHD